ncbi:MAG: nicotinate-nucleotide--dimethylbenzimidazole phosphoribosyltransferase [Jatrophihabitantaceae bacterium]
MTEFQPPPGFSAAAGAVADPDPAAAHAARLRQRELATPAGSLGMLEELAVWAAGVQGRCPPGPFADARTVLFAADHGIAKAGVAGDPELSTGQLVRLVAAGRAPVNAVAAGLPIRVVDVAVAEETGLPTGHRVRRSSGRIDVEDALGAAEVAAAIAAGMAVAEEEVESGAELLLAGNLGVAAGTPSATLVAVLTDTEPVRVTGRGDGIDDAAWIRKCAAIRDARRRAWPHRDDPIRLLAVAGGADLAALTGFLVRAASLGVPVLLDGLVACSAALTAQLACPQVVRWCLAGQQSGEPAHELALRRLGLTPVLRLGVELDQGVGALLALPVLRAATRALADTATRPAG